MAPEHAREFDIAVFGATGFTGQLAAEYLVRKKREGGEVLRLALAGRNEAKLAQVSEQLGAPELPRVVVDSFDEEGLLAFAARARVVISTVGPYSKYGSALVSACARSGTHYCDLTGESPFIRTTIDLFDNDARRTGARIVHCCGYDSIPSDLGTLVLQKEWEARNGEFASEVVMGTGKTKGAFSGGTVATMLHVFELAGRDRVVRTVLQSPYSLNPDGVTGRDGADQLGVRYSKELKSWTAPFIMAGINTRVVRRSHALMGQPWGEDFRYSECMSLGGGLRGWLSSVLVTFGIVAFMVLLMVPFTRRILAKRLPKPGEGPDRAQRAAGYFNTHLIGIGGDKRLEVVVAGDQDPGYGSTALMLSEAALCLCEDEASLSSEGGILTPATAMGEILVERLRRAGLRFDVV